jgi:hypothetical protein
MMRSKISNEDALVAAIAGAGRIPCSGASSGALTMEIWRAEGVRKRRRYSMAVRLCGAGVRDGAMDMDKIAAKAAGCCIWLSLCFTCN